MATILEMWTKYEYIAVAGLLLLQVILVVVTMGMVRRLSRYVKKIHKSVQNYLEVIMEEADADEGTAVAAHISMQERQLAESVNMRKKQQEEAVFNAVLQEIFP